MDEDDAKSFAAEHMDQIVEVKGTETSPVNGIRAIFVQGVVTESYVKLVRRPGGPRHFIAASKT